MPARYPGRRRCFTVVAFFPGLIHQIPQFLARLEKWNTLRWNFHPRSGFRISSHTRLPLARAKTAESADLDLISFMETVHDAVEDGLHDCFRILASHLHDFGYFFDQLGFGHITILPLFFLVVLFQLMLLDRVSYGGRRRHGLPLIVAQAVLLVFFRDRAQA